jgi:hypothetical protein
MEVAWVADEEELLQNKFSSVQGEGEVTHPILIDLEDSNGGLQVIPRLVVV